jgi:hypothetical protein
MDCLRRYLGIAATLVWVGMATACGSSSDSSLDGGTSSNDGSSKEPTGDACSGDTDCRTFESTCGDCSCLALGKTAPDPICTKGQVSCRAPSCTDVIAVCRNKRCVSAPKCKTDGDCRVFDSYCGECACHALGKTEPDPKCSGELAECGPAAACYQKEPWCDLGKCSTRSASSG